MTSTLTRPNLMARAVSLIALAACALTLYLLLQGAASYTLKLAMSNANGIRSGSQVLLGGVPVGSVGSVGLGPRSLVIVDLNLNRRLIRIGRGVRASVIAANLLGEEYVSLTPGNPHQPLPSGTILPQSQITVPTDLDQIVDVFNGTVRQRLAILINEMGIAVAGRRSDVSATLRQLPLSVPAATQLLTQLVQDNHTLADVVANSNQFIARIDEQKADLGRVIDAAAGAATTAADQAGNLSQTLIDAPQALTTLRSFIANVGQTSLDLTPAATQIQASAGSLNTLLDQVRPFERAAVPALNEAAAVAPLLTELGDRATPIVTKAVPTLAALANIAKIAYPLTYWLNLSVPDLLAVAQGWARSIQFRDGLGHVFHAEVGILPTTVINLAGIGSAAKANRSHAPKSHTKKTGTNLLGTASGLGAGVTHGLGGIVHSVTGLLGGVSGGLGSAASGAVNGLGGTVKHVTGTASSGSSSGASKPADLGDLLNYLLGK